MFEIRLTKHYETFRLDIDFTADAGVTALFGPSGAGKSSILNMVAGLLQPDRGRIVVDGAILFDSEQSIDLPPEKRQVGDVFQDTRLFPHISVRRNLTYGQRFTPPERRYVEIETIVDLLDIAPLLNRRPASLSGGEKQRVAIGRALLTSPRILLLDEPMASLDAARKEEILPYLQQLKSALSIPMLYVSHSAAEVERLADNVIYIQEGSIAKTSA